MPNGDERAILGELLILRTEPKIKVTSHRISSGRDILGEIWNLKVWSATARNFKATGMDRGTPFSMHAHPRVHMLRA